MKDFIKVLLTHDVPTDTGRTVEVDGIWIAIFNVQGIFYAIDNCCPHAGGPLGEGILRDGVVECPWHGWKFDVTSGERVGNPHFQVPCCEVRIQGDEVQVCIPPALRNPA